MAGGATAFPGGGGLLRRNDQPEKRRKHVLWITKYIVLSQPPPTEPRTPTAGGGVLSQPSPTEPRTPTAGGSAVAVVSASILAITEDAEVKDLLLEMALSDGFGVRCATTEAEAAKLLHRERPGLLLVDLDMAGR